MDALDSLRKTGIEEKLRQIVNEMRTAEGADALVLGFLGQFEEHLIAAYADAFGIKETTGFKPPPGGGMQIMRLAEKGVFGFVADDAHFNALPHGVAEELQHTRVGLCIHEARTIDVALHLRPVRLMPSLPQVIAHCGLCRNQPTFDRHAMKNTIVADCRVVEINSNDHAGRSSVSIRCATLSAVRP